jgi:GAF domain-containing protein
LKTNLARFTRMLQGERDLVTVSNLILSELAPLVNACRGVFYVARLGQEQTHFELIASYAFNGSEDKPQAAAIAPGEGLVGQCAVAKKRSADWRQIELYRRALRLSEDCRSTW